MGIAIVTDTTGCQLVGLSDVGYCILVLPSWRRQLGAEQ